MKALTSLTIVIVIMVRFLRRFVSYSASRVFTAPTASPFWEHFHHGPKRNSCHYHAGYAECAVDNYNDPYVCSLLRPAVTRLREQWPVGEKPPMARSHPEVTPGMEACREWGWTSDGHPTRPRRSGWRMLA